MLVHGEAERNDMVEYFGEHLDGFVFTQNGWVQSYGSRCVKPPIVIGDISRPAPITVEWAKYAQSLTDKPVKGMLTGPVTILCWSFPREDVSRETIAKQIALALRDEVADPKPQELASSRLMNRRCAKVYRCVVATGMHISSGAWRPSVSTPPWRKMTHKSTLTCVIASSTTSWIRLRHWMQTSSPSKPRVPTWSCWSRLKSLIIRMKSVQSVYDIHSPNVPSVEWIEALLKKAAKRIPAERLWVNPDCGLKTRGWPETRAALANMVQAAQNLRRG